MEYKDFMKYVSEREFVVTYKQHHTWLAYVRWIQMTISRLSQLQ